MGIDVLLSLLGDLGGKFNCTENIRLQFQLKMISAALEYDNTVRLGFIIDEQMPFSPYTEAVLALLLAMPTRRLAWCTSDTPKHILVDPSDVGRWRANPALLFACCGAPNFF